MSTPASTASTPFSYGAERSVLGGLLDQPRLQEEVLELTPAHFADRDHRHVFETMVAIRKRGDVVTAELLKKRLEEADCLSSDPVEMITGLLYYGASSPAQARQDARLLVELAGRRRLIHLGQLAQAGATNGSLPETIVALEEEIRLVRNETARDSEELPLRWVTDVCDDLPEPPAEYVRDLLRAGELCVVAAPRAFGKSWWAMNLAVLLGRGEGLFLGKLPIERRARVLLVQGELDEWGSAERWAKLTGDEQSAEGVAETFDRSCRIRILQHRQRVDGRESSWAEAELDERLERTIVKHEIDVLIIDPWAVFFGGNENSNDETQAALEKLRDLAMRHGIAVVILHHISGKSSYGREPEDMWRGATRLADWASTRVTLLPYYDAESAQKRGMTRQQARCYVKIFFLRRAAPIDDFTIALDLETGWWSAWQSSKDVAQARRKEVLPERVVELCRASGGQWASVNVAAKALEVHHGRARTILEEVVRLGMLETFSGTRGATGYREPRPSLSIAEGSE